MHERALVVGGWPDGEGMKRKKKNSINPKITFPQSHFAYANMQRQNKRCRLIHHGRWKNYVNKVLNGLSGCDENAKCYTEKSEKKKITYSIFVHRNREEQMKPEVDEER